MTLNYMFFFPNLTIEPAIQANHATNTSQSEAKQGRSSWNMDRKKNQEAVCLNGMFVLRITGAFGPVVHVSDKWGLRIKILGTIGIPRC